MTILGIDIGLTGAIAAVRGDHAGIWDVPTTIDERTGKKRVNAPLLAERIHCACGDSSLLGQFDAVAFVEATQATPQMGVSSAFGYGETTGLVKGVLAHLRVPVRLVPPLKWKRALGLTTKGSREIGRNEARDKGSALELARKLYPQLADELRLKKHDGRAEALLIAHYGAEEMGL